MPRSRRSLIGLVALLIVLAGCGSMSGPMLIPSDPALEDLAWLTGAWVTDAEHSDTRTEEIWSTPDGSVMLGTSRTVTLAGVPAERQTLAFEFLRIEHAGAGEVIYHASPGGTSATPFTLTERTATRFVFTNPGHDYPQTIIYEQQYEGTLFVRIEGVEQGEPKAAEWVFRRARLMSGLTEAERRARARRELWHDRQIYEDSLLYRLFNSPYD